MEKVVIIGSGPAGHTAAIYTARAGLAPVMYEGLFMGGVSGGQLMTTTDIENFPGHPDGITGPNLMAAMRRQSERMGCRFLAEDVASADLSGPLFTVRGDTVTECRALILATGATAKRLDIPSGERLWQRGISACAVCDGALPIFRNRPLLVVGGGDTAIEEALHLAHFGSVVYLAHRRDQFRACPAMQKRAFENPKIKVLWNTVLVDAFGDKKVEGASLRNLTTHETQSLELAGIFYAIGHTPNTAFLAGQLKLDEAGYLVTEPGGTRTSVPGVFACGDVCDPHYRQAVTAAGSGCKAALDAQRYLEVLGV
ncbi:MAG: thioredoxin-disulfide reductase [Fibrobacterota bacterium]